MTDYTSEQMYDALRSISSGVPPSTPVQRAVAQAVRAGTMDQMLAQAAGGPNPPPAWVAEYDDASPATGEMTSDLLYATVFGDDGTDSAIVPLDLEDPEALYTAVFGDDGSTRR